jgi:putative copper resistance protein D
MLALIVVVARLAQFAPAAILFGTPLFFLYALPVEGLAAAKALKWPRPLLLGAALVLAAGVVASLSAQTAVMTGSAADAFKWASVASVITGTQFGAGTTARLALAVLAALVLIFSRPTRVLWLAAALLGAGAVVSFAWTGHGASDDGMAGWVHLGSDAFHLLAAAVWLGALAGLSGLLFSPSPAVLKEDLAARHRALEGFSGIGSAVVAVLLATGLINSWFLVGPSHLGDLVRTAYGLVLIAKIALFAVMLALAASNRFVLTPRLGRALAGEADASDALAGLRRSVLIETSVGVLVLILVSLLGTLEPLTSQ